MKNYYNTEYGKCLRIFVFIGNIIQTSNFWLLWNCLYMHSPNYIYIYTPNNSRSGPVSGDNSNKQIFMLHIFRGNKQIDYRRVRQLSNLLVCRQGRKSAYYPPVTIFIPTWHILELAKAYPHSTCLSPFFGDEMLGFMFRP